MKIATERVYDKPKADGFRVLVDRLWPRGLSKAEARVDLWLKDLGPSGRLRGWFGHDPAKWDDFKRKYFAELDGKRELIDELLTAAAGRPIVLVFGAKDAEHNQAVALKEYLEGSLTRI